MMHNSQGSVILQWSTFVMWQLIYTKCMHVTMQLQLLQLAVVMMYSQLHSACDYVTMQLATSQPWLYMYMQCTCSYVATYSYCVWLCTVQHTCAVILCSQLHSQLTTSQLHAVYIANFISQLAIAMYSYSQLQALKSTYTVLLHTVSLWLASYQLWYTMSLFSQVATSQLQCIERCYIATVQLAIQLQCGYTVTLCILTTAIVYMHNVTIQLALANQLQLVIYSVHSCRSSYVQLQCSIHA